MIFDVTPYALDQDHDLSFFDGKTRFMVIWKGLCIAVYPLSDLDRACKHSVEVDGQVRVGRIKKGKAHTI